MKKIIVLVMVIAMILTFVGCSKVEEVTTTSSTLLDYHVEGSDGEIKEAYEWEQHMLFLLFFIRGINMHLYE